MTIATTANTTTAQGNGATVNFNYGFLMDDAAHAVVIYTDVNGNVTTLAAGQYGLTGVGVAAGGTFSYQPGGAPMPLGSTLTISRQVPYTQGSSIANQGNFYPAVIEAALDYLTYQTQQISQSLGRIPILPLQLDSSLYTMTLPVPLANAVLGWDATGKRLTNVIQAGGIATPLGIAQGGTSAVTVTAALTNFGFSAFVKTLLGAATAVAFRGLIAAAQSVVTTKGDIYVFGAAEDRQAIGLESAALIADPAQASGMQWVRLGAGSVRQSVLSAALDGSGYNAAITTGAGLRPGLDAAPTPMVVAFASGFGAGGSQDLTATLTADVADILGADAKLSNTTFVHATSASLSSVTWGSTLIPLQYGYSFDRTKQSLLNFEAADATTTFLDDSGNTWTASGNAQIDTAQFKFGTASALFDGTGDYISTSNITSLGDGSWEISFWFRINALPGVGANEYLFNATNAGSWGLTCVLVNTAGTTKMRMQVSHDGTTWGSDVDGANTVWTLNQWNKVRLVFDALGGSYKAYLSLNGAAETTDRTYASTSRVCAISVVRLAADVAGNQAFNGWMDAFRFLPCATNTSTETPSAAAPTIADYPIHFFSIPQMKMFEVTAASGAAGVDPTMTQRNRVFNAEFDTSGAAVTIVRNYMLRGQYISAPTALSGATTNFSTNIGTKLVNTRMKFQNKNNGGNGYVVGDEVDGAYSRRGGVSWASNHVRIQRNVISYVPMNQGAEPFIVNDPSLNDVAIPTMTNWSMRLEAERAF